MTSAGIVPNLEQFQQLVAAPDEGPVVMVNLLKFKDAEAYRRYGNAAIEMIEAQGGRILWAGRGQQVLIGDPTRIGTSCWRSSTPHARHSWRWSRGRSTSRPTRIANARSRGPS